MTVLGEGNGEDSDEKHIDFQHGEGQKQLQVKQADQCLSEVFVGSKGLAPAPCLRRVCIQWVENTQFQAHFYPNSLDSP